MLEKVVCHKGTTSNILRESRMSTLRSNVTTSHRFWCPERDHIRQCHWESGKYENIICARNFRVILSGKKVDAEEIRLAMIRDRDENGPADDNSTVADMFGKRLDLGTEQAKNGS
jgi:hypothetical protein